jgi:hypothetical protein
VDDCEVESFIGDMNKVFYVVLRGQTGPGITRYCFLGEKAARTRSANSEAKTTQ